MELNAISLTAGQPAGKIAIMKITIREVAERANVSIGTVSRVLNGHPSVSPQNVDRVRSVVRSINYRPLRRRSKLKEVDGLKGKQIGLVLLAIDRTLASLPSVASAVHGVEAGLAEQGATTLLINAPDPAVLPAPLELEQLDGVIIKGAMQGDLHASLSTSFRKRLADLACVWIMGRPEGSAGDHVCANDVEVGRLAAEALLSHGHRRLAFVNPKADHQLFLRREMSFTWHAERAGAQVTKFVKSTTEQVTYPLQPVRMTEQVGDLVDALLNARPRPTAVFVPADSVAVLVYRALSERGLKIGEDVSIVSCNYEPPLIAGVWPDLTTIDIHSEAVGRKAVRVMSERLSGAGGAIPLEIQLSPSVVAGGSVAKLRR